MCMRQIEMYIFVPNLQEIYIFGKRWISAKNVGQKSDLTVKNSIFVKLWYPKG